MTFLPSVSLQNKDEEYLLRHKNIKQYFGDYIVSHIGRYWVVVYRYLWRIVILSKNEAFNKYGFGEDYVSCGEAL